MNPVLAIEEPCPHVLLLTLDRPAQRNAIDLALLDELNKAFDRFRSEAHWRVAIITGRSPAFCAGLDLKTFSAPDAPRHCVGDMIRAIPLNRKPIIAAVNGAAYTGGFELALACDFILASEDARFADTHAKIGALSGSGMGSRLPHAVGTRFAKQMALSCQSIDAATALRVGIANEVLPPDRLMSRALEVATAIAAHDPELVQVAKSVLDLGSNVTLAEAIAIEAEALAQRKADGAMTWTTPLT